MKRIPQNEIYRILSGLAGTVGLYVEDCQSGEIFTINPEHVFPSASVIKVPMLALLMRDAQQGLVDLDAPRTLDPRNRVGGTGILCELGTDYTPSLRDLAKLMIVLSDNIATNEIMDVIGMERFNSFCREMGYQNITLMRKMMDFEAIQQGKEQLCAPGRVGVCSLLSPGAEFVNRRSPRPSSISWHLSSAATSCPPFCRQLPLLRLQVRHPGRAGPGGQQDRRPGGHQHDVGIF